MKHSVLLAGLLGAASITTQAQKLLVVKPDFYAQPSAAVAGQPQRPTAMQPEQMLVENYQAGTWQNVQRTLYSRYTGASLPGRLHTDKWLGTWQSVGENRRRYTSLGAVLTDTIVEFQTNPAGRAYAAIGNTYVNNQLRQELISNIDPLSNAWEEARRTTHFYNAAGQRTQLVQELNFFGAYDTLSRVRFTYNALGQMSESEAQTHSSSGTNWSNSEKVLYTYDAQGRAYEVVNQLTNSSGTYVNSSRVTYQFDGSSTRVTQAVVDQWNGAWVANEKHLVTYTADNYYLTELVQLWNGSAYQDAMRATFTYRTVTGASAAAALQAELAVAPNPLAASGTISYRLPAAATVSLAVVDMTGRVVRQLQPAQVQVAGRHTLPLAGEGLPAGLYFVRLTAGAHYQQVKLVVH